MTQTEVALAVYRQCIAAGATREAACGLLGNIQAESAFKPNNLEDTANTKLGMTDEEYVRAVDSGSYPYFVNDGFGFGIAQWTYYTRKQMFLNYVRSRGGSIGDLDLQIGFLLWELQNQFVSVWREMKTNSDLYGITKLLLEKWENPYEQVENMKIRYRNAQDWYRKTESKEVVGVTQNEAISKVLNLARSEIGYREKASNSQLDDKTANAGSGNWTKYARDLANVANFYNGGKNGYAWCDVFVDWLFVKCFGADTGRQMVCQPLNSAGAGCLYSAQYYKQAGRWTNQPQPGDQIFFSYAAGEYSHTGIVESVANGTVTTIEGNTSDQVGRRNYPMSSGSIVGYGRPRWELATGASSDTVVFTPVQSSSGILKRGAFGPEVKSLQEKLIKLGYNLGRWGADGDFGSDTFEAVKKFQEDHGLENDGEAGPITLSAIDMALKEKNTAPSPAPSKPQEQVKSYFAVGDIVQFTGSQQFKTSAMEDGSACKAGRALVTSLNKSAKCPYRLCKINGYGSTVNGWVSYGDVRAV